MCIKFFCVFHLFMFCILQVFSLAYCVCSCFELLVHLFVCAAVFCINLDFCLRVFSFVGLCFAVDGACACMYSHAVSRALSHLFFHLFLKLIVMFSI